MTVANGNKYLDPLPLSKTEAGGNGSDIETPPVTKSGSQKKPVGTPTELAFWEWSEPYTGMARGDIEKSSHGRAFRAGWLAAMKQAARLLNQLHDAESLKSDPSGLRRKNV